MFNNYKLIKKSQNFRETVNTVIVDDHDMLRNKGTVNSRTMSVNTEISSVVAANNHRTNPDELSPQSINASIPSSSPEKSKLSNQTKNEAAASSPEKGNQQDNATDWTNTVNNSKALYK